MSPARRLGWLIPPREREFVLGDLEELYGTHPGRLAWEIIRVGIALHQSPDGSLAVRRILRAHRAPLRHGSRRYSPQ